jgi:hypothetical protein
MESIAQEFLQFILDWGSKEGWFEIVAIGKLPKTCCPNVKTEVIDFDKVEEKIRAKTSLKSCDALKIIPSQECLDFIELKGISEFLDRKPTETEIEKQVKKFGLRDKIHDSYFVFYCLLQNHPSMQKNYRNAYQELEKNYIVVIDQKIKERGEQVLAITLQFLAETASADKFIKKLEVELEGIIYEDLNINRPLLKYCEDIDSYYADSTTKP